MKKLKIIISGGGTGGHIFPALSIAGEFRNRFPDCEIQFVGALGRMEMEKVPAAGYPITGLPVIGMPRKPGLDSLRFLWKLWLSMNRARKIIREFQPDIAIGVGGFASGPLLRAAVSAHIPALIQEQNSFAGKTNQWLGDKAGCICVAYDGMEKFFPAAKIVLTGNPVRKNLLTAPQSKEEALSWFHLDRNRKTVLLTGGSLGARSLNNAVLQNLEVIRNSGYSVIWQTGSLYFREMTEKTKGILPETVQIHQFLDRMELAYSAADIVVSRAGAGTISELCLVAKPVILIPSPNVAEDHQTRNAMALVQQEAAIMIRDEEIGVKLFPEVNRLLNNPPEMEKLSENISKLALPDATSRIVDEALKLIRK